MGPGSAGAVSGAIVALCKVLLLVFLGVSWFGLFNASFSGQGTAFTRSARMVTCWWVGSHWSVLR